MSQFDQIPSEEPIKEVIKAAFDTDLPLEGGWGYTMPLATIIRANPDNIPLTQFEHMIASMRAYLEMNMTRPKEERYGSINLNEKSRETIEEGEKIYHHVIYEISAMKESDYAAFIEAYKEGYGKEDFDMEEHFQRRKEATLVRMEPHWFEVSQVL
jgi:hypothetical protein